MLAHRSAGLRTSRLYFLDQWGDAGDSSPAPSALPGQDEQYDVVVYCSLAKIFLTDGQEM